jgi:beta-1,4-mannosyl-glycoprotein beta-1,4-N-acetylglucosaminyltransferase
MIKTPQDIRNNRHFYTFVRNGGWHYSSMGGKERIRQKFDAFAETDFNLPSLMCDDNLDKCLETGKDLTDRQEEYAQKRFITESEITHKEVLEWKNEYTNFYK